MGKNLDKKLGVWGKDKIIRDNKFYAVDYYCVRCYGENKRIGAEKFWPNVDVDIESFPYCKRCIDDLNSELLISLYGLD